MNYDKDILIFLLASLIVSCDKIANIPAVYGCYLKKYKTSSLKEFILQPIHKYSDFNMNITYNLDLFSLN